LEKTAVDEESELGAVELGVSKAAAELGDPRGDGSRERRKAPVGQGLRNAGGEEGLREGEDQAEGLAIGEGLRGGIWRDEAWQGGLIFRLTLDYGVPERSVVPVLVEEVCDFEKPGDTDPRAEEVAEGVQDLEGESIIVG
jgi:hypothetical protein